MDIYFFQLANQCVSQSARLFFFAVDSAEASWKLAALVLVGLWFSGISSYSQQSYINSLSEHRKQQRTIRGRVILLFAVMVTGFVAARVLQHFFEQQRPMAVAPMLVPFDPAIWTKMKMHISEQGSFPSDHAVMWFTVAMGTFLVQPITGTVGLIIAVILCFFRMGTGYHWASDIFAGSVLGIGLTVLAFSLIDRISFLRTWLYRLVDAFEQYPVPMYLLGFLIISDFAVKFSGLFGVLKSIFKVSVGH